MREESEKDMDWHGIDESLPTEHVKTQQLCSLNVYVAKLQIHNKKSSARVYCLRAGSNRGAADGVPFTQQLRVRIYGPLKVHDTHWQWQLSSDLVSLSVTGTVAGE